MLAPGGRLAVSVWRAAEHNPGWLRLTEALERQAGPDTGAIMRAPFALGAQDLRDRSETSATSRSGSGSRRCGFPRRGSSCFGGGRVAARRAAVGAERRTRDALVRDFADAVRAHTDDDGVSFPMETHVVTAIR